MSEVEITTDGSCLGNPGPGGWACILRCGQHERVLQGGVADTTNNRMELIAAIEGLRALKRASQVTVLTDSEYVRRGITEFLPRWKANGWRASTGKPVVNRDLWEELEELAGYHEVTTVNGPKRHHCRLFTCSVGPTASPGSSSGCYGHRCHECLAFKGGTALKRYLFRVLEGGDLGRPSRRSHPLPPLASSLAPR